MSELCSGVSASRGQPPASRPATSGYPPPGSIIHSCQVFGKGLISHQQPGISPSHGSPEASTRAWLPPQHRLSVAVLMRSWIPALACPPPARVLMSSRGRKRAWAPEPGSRKASLAGLMSQLVPAPPVPSQCPGFSCPGASLQHQAACCTWPLQLWQCLFSLDVFSASGRPAGLTSRLPRPVL